MKTYCFRKCGHPVKFQVELSGNYEGVEIPYSVEYLKSENGDIEIISIDTLLGNPQILPCEICGKDKFKTDVTI